MASTELKGAHVFRTLIGRIAIAVALITAGVGAVATPVSASPVGSSANPALSPDHFRADEVGALARLKLRSTGEMEALAAETFADIACRNTPFRMVREKGWGVGYAGNRRLQVFRDLFIDGDWWKTMETYPTTSSSGSWSTPTTDHPTFLGGDHMIWVTAYYDGGSRVGRDTDVCDH